MYVLGFNSRMRWPAIVISAESPCSFFWCENLPPCSPASKSTNQKPTLWRVASYSAPGFPRPTIKSIGVPIWCRCYGFGSAEVPCFRLNRNRNTGTSRAERPPEGGLSRAQQKSGVLLLAFGFGLRFRFGLGVALGVAFGIAA